MIIDFHAHVFPDKIAFKTIDALAKMADVTPYSDGTAKGLADKLNMAGVDLAINLPVLTKPTQFESVLEFAIAINKGEFGEGKILSFAGVHPDLDNVEEKLKLLKDNGIKGFKIHPEYQSVFIDDERYINILLTAKKLGLIVVTHAGVDEGFLGGEVKCSPKRVLNLLEKIGGYDKLVLAHLGGNLMHEEVYELLAGKNVYLDTSYVIGTVGEDYFLKLLSKHGEDKILFATDSPWNDVKTDVEVVKSFDLNERVKDKIFYKNALKLLGL